MYLRLPHCPVYRVHTPPAIHRSTGSYLSCCSYRPQPAGIPFPSTSSVIKISCRSESSNKSLDPVYRVHTPPATHR